MNKSILMLMGCAVLLVVASCDSAESLTQKGNEALAQGDAAKAAEYFTKAADKQNPEAMRNLGQLYAAGNGVEASAEKAAELFGSASELGDSIAPYLLGQCYEAGNGVKTDNAKAFELYRKSAEAGYPEASVKLTDFYFRGREGVETDWGKAYLTAQKCADNPDAKAIVGYFTATGTYGAPRDFEGGQKMLRESADKGSALGKALLAYTMISGVSGAEGARLASEAAEAGEPFGIAIVGYGYECGSPRGSFATAAKYYQDAAAKGCVWALWRNGMMHIDLMNKKDAGHELIRQAAKRGDGEALNRLGYSYLNGYGETMSSEKAFETFVKGAEKGNPTAMSNVAWCYEEGEGVTADKQKDIEWYEKAVKYGDPYFSQQRLKALK